MEDVRMGPTRYKPTLNLKTNRSTSGAAESRRMVDHQNCEGLALALFEETDDALILVDAKSQQILDVNAAAQRLCGISVRDLLESPVSTLFRTGQWEKLESEFRPVRRVRLPYGKYGSQLRTFTGDRWVSVDVNVTRLIVKPQSLILLTIRAVDQSANDGDSRIIVERLDRALNRPANCHGGAVENPIA